MNESCGFTDRHPLLKKGNPVNMNQHKKNEEWPIFGIRNKKVLSFIKVRMYFRHQTEQGTSCGIP